MRPFAPADADAFREWRYDGPYAIYDQDGLEADLSRAEFFSILLDGAIVGYVTFGADAQVPGGDYSLEALDIGMGLNPMHIGLGLGTRAMTSAIELAKMARPGAHMRATIAAWNERALNLTRRAGLVEYSRFVREDTVLETYAHVTPKMRSSAVSKIRDFFGQADAIAPQAGVATPRVDTGAEVGCDPPVQCRCFSAESVPKRWFIARICSSRTQAPIRGPSGPETSDTRPNAYVCWQ